MSGPKSYSVSVFDKSISNLFHGQTELQALMEEIRELSVSDSERGIDINCEDFLDSERGKLKELLEPFKIEYTGRISQRIYRDLKFKLFARSREVKEMVERLKSQKSDIEEKRKDYDTFAKYEEHFDRKTSEVFQYQKQLAQHLNQFANTAFADAIKNASRQIDKIKLTSEKAKFHEDFQRDSEELMLAVQKDVERCQTELGAIRMKVNEVIGELAADLDINMPTGLSQSKEERKYTDKVQQITDYISDVQDERRRNDYTESLDRIVESSASSDIYYLVELFDEIKKTEKFNKLKADLQVMLSELISTAIVDELSKEKTNVLTSGSNLLSADKIDRYQIEALQAQIKTLKTKNKELQLELAAKLRERLFIKDQLVSGLKSFNYQVMEDMQVVDFEKQNDFLLKVPGQTNYLNLRFNPDGSLLYNFLIQEDKESLSIDQKQKKLDEMESVCSEFKEVLKEMTELGLKVDLKKELDVSEKALIRVPTKYSQLTEAEEIETITWTKEEELKVKR